MPKNLRIGDEKGSIFPAPGGRHVRVNKVLLFGWVIVFGLTGCVTPPPAPRVEAPKGAKKLDTGPFWWGIASSSFQNENRTEKPGDPNFFKTDWDLFAEAKRVPPKGDEAVSSWTHF
ncbi:MAG: hypothetical protein ACOYNN_04265, partial [Terrimicrobiaceae bacterium]